MQFVRIKLTDKTTVLPKLAGKEILINGGDIHAVWADESEPRYFFIVCKADLTAYFHGEVIGVNGKVYTKLKSVYHALSQTPKQ